MKGDLKRETNHHNVKTLRRISLCRVEGLAPSAREGESFSTAEAADDGLRGSNASHLAMDSQGSSTANNFSRDEYG